MDVKSFWVWGTNLLVGFLLWFFFSLKSEACDKSIFKSFYNNDPLCGEPWFLRLRTRDKNFVYSHDSTYLMTWSWMKNLLMRVWPSNTKVRDKKNKGILRCKLWPIVSIPSVNFSHIGNFIFIMPNMESLTWVRLKLSREVVNKIYLFK